MLNKDLLLYVEKMQQDEKDILFKKGKEYSGHEDCHRNFKTLAEDLGISPEQVLWVYLKKHLDSVRSYIKEGKTFSNETIHSRINDARNYLALLSAMISEKENPTQG